MLTGWTAPTFLPVFRITGFKRTKPGGSLFLVQTLVNWALNWTQAEITLFPLHWWMALRGIWSISRQPRRARRNGNVRGIFLFFQTPTLPEPHMLSSRLLWCPVTHCILDNLKPMSNKAAPVEVCRVMLGLCRRAGKSPCTGLSRRDY